MRLIDAYALQDEIQKSKMENPHKDAKVAKNHEFEHEHFMKMVVLQPTAQEEVVRCKDCKYWLPMNRFDLDYHPGRGQCELNCWVRDFDWFCGDGKRKEDR